MRRKLTTGLLQSLLFGPSIFIARLNPPELCLM
jgi:hypothetical protein